uniref:Uncharacterized protein n=1 Tax=Sphaerodactylus townsendi TaxID=933632 RepID=A0ACB8GC02_9SAUR
MKEVCSRGTVEGTYASTSRHGRSPLGNQLANLQEENGTFPGSQQANLRAGKPPPPEKKKQCALQRSLLEAQECSDSQNKAAELDGPQVKKPVASEGGKWSTTKLHLPAAQEFPVSQSKATEQPPASTSSPEGTEVCYEEGN